MALTRTCTRIFVLWWFSRFGLGRFGPSGSRPAGRRGTKITKMTRSPRIAEIRGVTKVSVKGDRVILNGIDKRDLGDTAANIERATKIKGFDLRVFQDGIYIMKG